MSSANNFYLGRTDVEASISAIREWSRDNTDSSVDWRRMHSAANILSVALFDGATLLSEFRGRVSESKQRVRQAEALAQLRAIADLTTGRAKLPTGESMEAVSYSVAKDLSRQFIPIDAQVINANAALLTAEAQLTEYEQKLEALKELAQGAKSTARNLTQEPV